jgi:LysR family hydrogen peroxide-inducible transcriptional activator
MNLQQLKYVLSLAKHQHFETAADACFISQSTISTMISKLESELGIVLFDRSKKPVSLTTEGQNLLPKMQSIVSDMNGIYELAQEIRGECTGEWRFAGIPTIAPYVIPDFLQEFAAQCPDVFFTVTEQTTAEIIRKIKSNEVDVGLISIPLNDPELEEIHLYNESLVLYDASSKGLGPIDPKEITVNNLCLLEQGHCLRAQILELCERVEKPFSESNRIHFVAGSLEGLIRHVRKNSRSTLFPFLATLDLNEEDKLHLRSFTTPIPFRKVGLVVRKNYPRRIMLNKAVEIIQNQIKPLLSDPNLDGTPLLPIKKHQSQRFA